MTGHRAVHSIDQEKLDRSSAKDLAIVGGICNQNYRLASGQSTENYSMMVKKVGKTIEKNTDEIKDLEDKWGF